MDLLTVTETAKLLKVTLITVRRYINDGRLPAVKVGRRVRVRREAIESFLSPVIPRRPVDAARDPAEQGGRTIEAADAPFRPMTEEQARQALVAVEQARRSHRAQREKRGGKPFPPTWELLAESRDQRTRDLA